ncbi:MAG: hypothetical protein JNL49_06535 [Bacteroidia bacterium]|nr:hypothetical protein [Bacteroidia bacterium]
MLKKHAILISTGLSIIFIVIATLFYPGGSIHDVNSMGFDWTKNFMSNLFGEKALNGADNPARIWAVIGMVFHSLTYMLFFVNVSTKIPHLGSAKIVKYLGLSNLIFIVLIATPLHDLMLPITSTIFLAGLFYITVFVLKSRLTVFKFLCVICLLLYYFTIALYGFGYVELLAIMQKVTFLFSLVLILGLEYYTTKEDFLPKQQS